MVALELLSQRERERERKREREREREKERERGEREESGWLWKSIVMHAWYWSWHALSLSLSLSLSFSIPCCKEWMKVERRILFHARPYSMTKMRRSRREIYNRQTDRMMMIIPLTCYFWSLYIETGLILELHLPAVAARV
jgi:hypothetical protein